MIRWMADCAGKRAAGTVHGQPAGTEIKKAAHAPLLRLRYIAQRVELPEVVGYAAVKEKNWNKLLDLVMSLIEEAEVKFDDGATRKEWVMAMVAASAESINYDIDMSAISALIDSLCDLTKKVNAPVDELPIKGEGTE